MGCLSCHGQLEQGQTAHAINRQGYHLIMDDVPAWVCQQCGEVLFEEQAVNAIQGLIQEAGSRIQALAHQPRRKSAPVLAWA